MEGPRAYFPQVVGYYAAVPAPQWAVEEYGVRPVGLRESPALVKRTVQARSLGARRHGRSLPESRPLEL